MTAGMLVPRIRQHTPEWLALKDQAISATDAAIISGERGSVLELAAIKLGLIEPPEPDDETRLLWDDGLAMQPFLLDAYRRRTGRRVQAIHGIRQRKDWPVAICSPDGSVVGESGRGLELKMSSSPKWPEAIATGEQVPGDVRAQVQWQMYVVGWDVVDVVVLLYGRPKIIEVERDDRYIDDEVYLARHFWQEHEAGILPQGDGSENARRALARMHPRAGAQLIPSSPAIDRLISDWVITEGRLKELEGELGSIKNTVRALIADDAGIEGRWGRVTLRNNRRIDWPAVAAELDPPDDLVAMHTHTDWKAVAETLRPRPAVIARHVTADGPRVMRPTFKGQPALEEISA